MARATDDRFERRCEAHFGDRVFRCFVNRPRSVPALFAAAVDRAPEGDALSFEGERLSYRRLSDAVDRVAANLAAWGVRPGDRVALLLGNRFPFVYALLGALRLGAIAVPLSTRDQRPGLSFIINSCRASVLIFDAELVDRAPRGAEVASLRYRFAVGGEAPGASAFEQLLEAGPSRPPLPEAGEEDTAVILYTSGTTGQPKGAMLTHLNLIHSVMHYEESMALGTGERSLLAVPASHVTGLVAIILTMIRVAGCTVIMREFDARAFIALAAAERVSHTLMVPAMYNLCLLRGGFSSADLSAWRVGGFGGAPMPEATIARLAEVLPDLRLMNIYGATETTSPATTMPFDMIAERADSIGRSVPCGDIRIMDGEGREMPDGQPGEIWIAGPMVVPGYWDDADSTAANFTAGYWRSGDIGSRDREGFIYLLDRKKDMINRGGYKVYSAEVENVIAHHPGVAECAAVGQADPVLGEKIHVFISADNPALTAHEVREFCRLRLADYKIPDFVTLQSGPLPRNANGKLMKRELRERMARP